MGTCASCSNDNREQSQQLSLSGSAGDIAHTRNYLQTNKPQHSSGDIPQVREESFAIPAGLPRIPKAARSLESESLMTMRTASPGAIVCDTTLEDPAAYTTAPPSKRLSISSPLGVTAEGGQSGSGSSMGQRRVYKAGLANDQPTTLKDLVILNSAAPNKSSSITSRNAMHASNSGTTGSKNPLSVQMFQYQLLSLRDRVEKMSVTGKKNPMMPTMNGSPRVGLGGSTASSAVAAGAGALNNSAVAALYQPRRRSSVRSDKSLSQSLKVAPSTTSAVVANPGHSFTGGAASASVGATIILAANHSGGADSIQLVRPVSAQLQDSVGNWLLQQPSIFAPEPIPDEQPSDAPPQSMSDDLSPPETSSSMLAPGDALESVHGGTTRSDVASPGLIEFGYECTSSLQQAFPVLSMPVFQNSAFPDTDCDY